MKKMTERKLRANSVDRTLASDAEVRPKIIIKPTEMTYPALYIFLSSSGVYPNCPLSLRKERLYAECVGNCECLLQIRSCIRAYTCIMRICNDVDMSTYILCRLYLAGIVLK